MKNRKFIKLVISLFTLLSFSVAGCQKISPTPTEISVTGVSLNKNSLSLKEGETYQLVAIVSPSDATNKEVTWSTTSSKYVTVSSTGLVSAVLEGSASVVVTTKDGKFIDSCDVTVTKEEEEIEETITEKKISGISSDFIFGMDASAVPSLENSGVKYYDKNGVEKDVFEILASYGINYIRVRIWNDPYDSNGNGYGGGNCDLANAIAIGKRATKYGMKLLLDFHYSDFWADPVSQKLPKAWASYSTEQVKDAIYTYTKESLVSIKNNNIDVGMVQIGNETNGFFCGSKDWSVISTYFNSGSKAVREVFPNALVALHFTNPEKNNRLTGYAAYLKVNNVDYDVFGSSYYPYWHGTLANLSSVLSNVATSYSKKVMIMETSYCYSNENYDQHPNTSPASGDVLPHDVSLQGQYDQIYDVISTAKDITNCIGVSYWEGTWIGVGTNWSYNKVLWERYGSGWASSYSSEYDPDRAGQYYGGCAVENQAFFSKTGKVLPSLSIFNQERTEEVGGTLVNGSFESGTTGWNKTILTDGISDISTFKVKTDSVKDGTNALNVWHADPIHFTVSQTVQNVSKGTHTFSFAVMGECEDYEMSLYVSSNGVTLATTNVTMTGWENWAEFTVEFSIDNKQDIEVGIDINFKSSGGWAYLDNAVLS